MKYTVLHSALLGPGRNFKRDEVVSDKDLKDAGFDPDFLLKNEAIEPLKGTEYDDALAMTANVEATPAAGDADPNAAAGHPAQTAHAAHRRGGKS